MSSFADSLERIVPELVHKEDRHAQASLELHYQRYRFAAESLHGEEILDIACGVGYGSEILFADADRALNYTGVDCSAEAINFAKATFARKNSAFVCADAFDFLSSSPKAFSTIISLETIEHLEDPKDFISKIYFALEDLGLAILSVPVSPTIDINPHHLNDFSARSFKGLLRVQGFEIVECFEQLQEVSLATLLKKDSYRAQSSRPSLVKFYLKNPSSLFRRIASCFRDGFSTRYLTIVAKKT